MTKVVAAITISLDGYITGPNDGPEFGLGEGGERLHYWVFGGPWTYETKPKGEATGADKEYLDGAMGRAGAVVIGRGMYEAADAWGGENPFGVPLFVVTHRPEDAPSEGGFTFVDGLDEAIARARQSAGNKDISVGGGADVIRQALRAGRCRPCRPIRYRTYAPLHKHEDRLGVGLQVRGRHVRPAVLSVEEGTILRHGGAEGRAAVS
jgi:dihydrofolate reductase